MKPPRSSLSRFVPPLLAIGAVCLGLAISIPLLADNDWDPSTFIKFPAAKPVELAYGNDVLGHVVPSPGFGHDGKFYFMQAMDPFYLTPTEHAAFLDRPTYRAQRMVYPLLAGGFGFLSPTGTAWGLWIVNIAALGIGTWLTALLAREIGVSQWFGLAFLFNPGIIVSSVIDTAEIVALTFMIAGALYVLRERTWLAVTFLTLAALSRETMIVASIGAIAYIWHKNRSVPWAYSVPFLASGAWWFYLRTRLGGVDSSIQDTQAIGPPLEGFVEAMRRWLFESGNEVDLLMGVLLLVLAVSIAWRAVRHRDLLLLMTAGFSVVAVLMVREVWQFYFDAARALVPLVTIYILASPALHRRDRLENAQIEQPVARV